MKYKYVFHSPIRFLIRINDSDIEDQEATISELQPKVNINLRDETNKLLRNINHNFYQYINKDGILDAQFQINKNNVLETVLIFNKLLKRKDFISLFTDIEGQLFAGIGLKIANMPIYQYDDIIEYKNEKGMLEQKVIKKFIFCLLWSEDKWKLKFIPE